MYVDGDEEDMSLYDINLAHVAYQKFIDDTMASAQQNLSKDETAAENSRAQSKGRVKKIAMKRKKSFEMLTRDHSKETTIGSQRQRTEIHKGTHHKDNDQSFTISDLLVADTGSNRIRSPFREKKNAGKRTKMTLSENAKDLRSEIIKVFSNTNSIPSQSKTNDSNCSPFESEIEWLSKMTANDNKDDDKPFNVGFEFRKYFPNLGWTRGKVTALYGDIRRVEYDGDDKGKWMLLDDMVTL